ncbi:hypothetical protein SO802_010692, partial [Lithocarpus litseifolius]
MESRLGGGDGSDSGDVCVAGCWIVFPDNIVHDMLSWIWKSDYFNNNVHVKRTNKAMSAFGFEIVQTLIVETKPNEHVKRAMSEINADLKLVEALVEYHHEREEMVIKTSIERQVIPNQTLRGFDKIDSIKEELEKACPGLVPCADIVSIATRDGIMLVGQHSFIFQQTPNLRRLGLFDFSIPCHVCSFIFF